MKKIFYTIIASVCMFGATSCSDMLDSESSRHVSDPQLNQKTDSIFYAYGIMQAMQQLADQYFFQNEMRGELVKPTVSATTHLKNLSDFSAGAENKYDSVYLYYKVINNCNYYLANRDTTLESGTRKVAINEFAGVAAFRAWAYLQLTTQYGNVPYITKPVASISEINASTAQTDYKQILAQQAEYMQGLKNKYAPDYLDAPIYSNAIVNIGHLNSNSDRIEILTENCFVPFNVVLGDLYLEIGEYAQAARCYYDYLVHAVDKASARGLEKSVEAVSINKCNSLQSRIDNFDIKSMADYNTGSKDPNGKLNNSRTAWDKYFTLSYASTTEQLSYIPMAVNHTMGQTTEIPKAFGYDFYSSTSRTNSSYNPMFVPQMDAIQVVPSEDYATLAYEAPYYYYSTEKDPVSLEPLILSVNKGDGRANIISQSFTNDDPEMVYVMKPAKGIISLYRNTTVWMHLAEALNRMGEPELAFTILKKGMYDGMKELVDTAAVKHPTIPEKKFYIPWESFDKLRTGANGMPPFLGCGRFTIASAKELLVGVHFHGAGAVEPVESSYSYYDVVDERIKVIRQQNAIDGAAPYTREEYINAVEDLLCDEYALEFAFEGRRFSDLLRIARHKNADGTYGAAFGDRWLSEKLKNKRAGITTQNCYLPFK